MEYLDVYNENREKIGKIIPKHSELDKGEYLVISHLCIFNSKGELLIQKRQSDKIDWPNMWDISAGGGAQAGESAQQAAERETWEELGLKVDLGNERPYLTVHYPKGFDDYYIIVRDVGINELNIQKEELTDIKWATKEEICHMMSDGTFVKYKDGFIDILFAMKEGRGSYEEE